MRTIPEFMRALRRRPMLPVCHLLLVLAGSALPARAQSVASFVDATSGPLGDTGSGFGVAWGDYDNDGDLDLYLANYGQANKLFRNEGGGTFVDATSGPLGDTGLGTGAAWGDYDHDGDLDLYHAKHGQANKLFRNEGGGTFVDATSGPLGDVGGGRSVAWGDYDADGDLDLFLTNIPSTGTHLSKLFRNDGGGTFVDASIPSTQAINSSFGAAWADFDNDHDLDLALTSFTAVGSSRVLINTKGDGVLDSGLLQTVGADVGVAWGDYDNDGDLDLFSARYNQASKLYRNDGGSALVDVTSLPEFAPLAGVGNSRAVAWGDYDMDGDLDLYLVRNNQANKLFRNDGVAGFVDVTAGPLGDTGSGQCVAWGDYDNDGDPDLYVSNSGQANKLLRNDAPAGNHWLKIRLHGGGSGRAGIGARVGIRTADGWQIREISGGSNYASQDAPEALFGLGSATTVDSMYVRWPSGMIEGVSPLPAVDQAITVVEPAVQPFSDVTSGSTGSASSAVAWGDYDGDGDLDICVSGGDPANLLLRNDGGSTFTEAPGPPLAPGSSAAWGDYDNDGDLDLAKAIFSGVNKLYRNDGAGSFTDMSASIAIGSGQTRSIIWGDYDNDGYIDLYVPNFDQGNRLFRNNGGANFTDVTVISGLQGAGSGWSAAFGDYDNDGDLDLFVPNGSSPSKLYRNDGGVFAVVPTGPAARALGAAWGDYDSDGDLDLYMTFFGGTSPGNALYRNDGGDVFVNVTNSPLLVGGGFDRCAAWGDYDNDGNLDLFVASDAFHSRLLRNYGGGRFENHTSNHLGDYRYTVGAAWGDYDNDGDLDLFQTGDASKLYRNNNEVTGRHWLRVKLVGTVSNRAAIGARVRVVTGGTSRIREISGGAGVMSQDGMVASFGLGSATTVDSLIVRWPTGVRQVVSPAPAVDMTLTVTELERLSAVPESILPKTAALHVNAPNPFNPITTISFDLASRQRVNLAIYDLAGRVVRILVDEERPAGRYEARWDGTNGRGRPVPSGVYVYRMEAGTFSEARRMTLLK